MVSLINHEYSRREAHGRLAWQSMPSNVLGERRGDFAASISSQGLGGTGHTTYSLRQSSYTC